MQNARIEDVLVRDKFENIALIARMLEKEIIPIVKNYLNLEDDVVVRYRKSGDKFVFDIEVKAERIKPFGMIIS